MNHLYSLIPSTPKVIIIREFFSLALAGPQIFLILLRCNLVTFSKKYSLN